VGGVIMDEYRENIISMINTIENVDLLEYLEEYIRLKIKAEE
jgi:hypothetical protein